MLITDGRRLSGAQYDCVIVGSGPAGLTVALDLAAANKRVLVLETDAGGRDCAPSIGYGHYAGHYWNAHAVRALGGTSAVWNGWCTTLCDEDFDNPAVGVSWPITRNDLLPHYRESCGVLDRHPSIIDYEKPFVRDVDLPAVLDENAHASSRKIRRHPAAVSESPRGARMHGRGDRRERVTFRRHAAAVLPPRLRR